VRPWAGATGQVVDADLAQMLGLDRPGGIIIAGLHPASPLVAAGFAVGDVVLAVDGAEVHSPGEMLFRMGLAGRANTVVMTRLRDGETADLLVDMISPPEVPARAAMTLSDGAALPGLSVARINPAVIAELGLSLEAEGVVVTALGTLGARVGLRVGDILQVIDGNDITAPQDAVDALERARRGTRVRALRRGTRVMLRF
jgi:S1-C subfamily serine protease